MIRLCFEELKTEKSGNSRLELFCAKQSKRFFVLLNKIVFTALLGLVAVAAIPYGTVEPWWKAAFVCAVFGIFIFAILESLTSGAAFRIEGASVLPPMLALTALAFVQTLSFGSREVWSAVSADPFQTRFFVLQMLALTAFLALLYRYVNTERRARALVYTILCVALASAVFGLMRQTTQHETGFVLPLLKQNQGYGQFINKNHFAYLMEMAFGLGLGISLAGGIKRDRVMIYVALLLPIWTGLVLANSRGGVVAMLAQVLVAVLVLLRFDPALPRSVSSRFNAALPRSVPSRFYPALPRSVLILLVAGVLLGTLWVGGDRLATNFEAATNELNASDSTFREGVTRNEIWRASLRMFAAQPILGAGLGGYWIGITAYHDASGRMTPQEAHNDYLELLASGGLIGFAIGAWFVLVLVRTIRQNLSLDNEHGRAVRVGAVLGLSGVAVHSLLDFGLHITVNALVFLSLIMLATMRIEQPMEK